MAAPPPAAWVRRGGASRRPPPWVSSGGASRRPPPWVRRGGAPCRRLSLVPERGEAEHPAAISIALKEPPQVALDLPS
ncbi:unnamed protein product [Urochloa humidicola]